MSYPSVIIQETCPEDGRFVEKDGRSWSVQRLIKHAEGLEPFDLPLCCVDLSVCPFAVDKLTPIVLAQHMVRVVKTSLKHPVILTPEGFIADGWHRVVQAILKGRRTIKAVRLEAMPYHDGREE